MAASLLSYYCDIVIVGGSSARLHCKKVSRSTTSMPNKEYTRKRYCDLTQNSITAIVTIYYRKRSPADGWDYANVRRHSKARQTNLKKPDGSENKKIGFSVIKYSICLWGDDVVIFTSPHALHAIGAISLLREMGFFLEKASLCRIKTRILSN